MCASESPTHMIRKEATALEPWLSTEAKEIIPSRNVCTLHTYKIKYVNQLTHEIKWWLILQLVEMDLSITDHRIKLQKSKAFTGSKSGQGSSLPLWQFKETCHCCTSSTLPSLQIFRHSYSKILFTSHQTAILLPLKQRFHT